MPISERIVVSTVFMVLAPGPLVAQSENPSPVPTDSFIEVRIAHDSAAPGLMPVSALKGDTPVTIYLEEEVVFSDQHVERAVAMREPGTDRVVGLRLDLTEEGHRRLEEATFANVGGTVAVVLGGGHVVLALQIAGPIGGTPIPIMIKHLDAGLAKRLTDQATSRWASRK